MRQVLVCVAVWVLGARDVDASPVDTGVAEDVGAVAAAPEEATAEGPVEPPAAAAPPVSSAPAVEVKTARKVRHDWYAGFGVGLGVGNLKPADSGSGTVPGVALIGYVRGGGRITDKVAIGGLGLTGLGGGNGAARGMTSLMAEALFFPVTGRGLAIAVALGLSSTYGGRANSMNMTMVEADRVRGGVGFGLGLGYDFWLARRFNLGLWLRGDGSAGPVYKVRAAGTFGLAFSWY